MHPVPDDFCVARLAYLQVVEPGGGKRLLEVYGDEVLRTLTYKHEGATVAGPGDPFEKPSKRALDALEEAPLAWTGRKFNRAWIKVRMR